MGDPASWDLVDEEFANLTGWNDEDSLNGVSEISPAGELHQDNSPATASSYARIARDIGTTPDTFTIEIKVYVTTIGAGNTGDDDFYIRLMSLIDNWDFFASWGTAGLFTYDGASFQEFGTDVVATGEWHIWRFLVTGTVPASATCDAYKDGVLVQSGVDCSWTGAATTEGSLRITTRGSNIATDVNVDYIKIATGLWTPPSGRRIFLIT